MQLKDLECYDEMYYVGHLVDVDGDGWVNEEDAQWVLDQINQPFSDKIDTPTLILIVILMMGLINGLMSCTSSRTVYQVENGWKPGPTKSSATGWTYTNERGMAQH